jgi:hypothetical protein
MSENNINSQEILPTRRETAAALIDSYLSVRGRNYIAIWSVIFGVLSLSWLADSTLPIVQDVFVWFYANQYAQPFTSKFGEHFIRLTPVLIIFTGVSAFLYNNHRKNLKAIEYQRIASEPRRGLIISLSDYQDFSKNLPSVADLEKAIDERRLDIENFFNNSNWGQLAFAAAHHSPLLQRCWICTTPKSTEIYQAAEKLVNYVSEKMDGRKIVCKEIFVEDENDISQTAIRVSEVYRNLEQLKTGLMANDVIADFTGGTAAMSGGIILATLDAGRKIEYVSQKYRGKLSLSLLRENQTAFAIISPATNLVMAERLSRLNYD